MTQKLTGRAQPKNLPRGTYFRRQTCARCGQHTDDYRFLPVTRFYVCTTNCMKEEAK